MSRVKGTLYSLETAVNSPPSSIPVLYYKYDLLYTGIPGESERSEMFSMLIFV
jgi:hypothetical protein